MNDAPNFAQAKQWSGPSGLSWITYEDEMDRLLKPVTQLLLHRAGKVSGLDVLDIGCGTGATSLAFADAGAQVMANDISRPLLERTAARGAGKIDTLLADAQAATWPQLYDLVVSRFGVMFFADPAAAFVNVARALRSGGVIHFAAWGPFDENPWWYMPQKIAARQLGVDASLSDPHVPGPMGLSDKAWALDRLKSPAFSNVHCETVDITLDDSRGAIAAGELATRLGPGARVLNMHEANNADRALVADAIGDALLEYTVGGTVRIPARLHLFFAQKV